MPGAETTKEGAHSVVLRLSLMRPEGLTVDYDEPVLNNLASYDAARAKLSDREREKVAQGWDVLGRFIVQTVDRGTDIETRVLRGKTWEFVGEPAEPPDKPRVEKPATTAVNGRSSSAVASEKFRHNDGITAEPSEAFLLELGELCMKHKVVIEGDGLRLSPFSMKAFRNLLSLGG